MLWALCAPAAVRAQSSLDQSDEIVFIDDSGFIRVWDPDKTAGNLEVQWRSPDAGWYDAALGDFNGDGDMEIAAIRAEDAGNEVDTVRLTIFDPVVTTGPITNPAWRFNDIPWDILYSTTLLDIAQFSGDPLDIASGHFIPGQSQDGLVIGAIVAGDDVEGAETPSAIMLLDAASADGRQWNLRFTTSFDHEWDLVRTGDADNIEGDEVVLIDNVLSALAVYRIANGMSDKEDRILTDKSASKKWRDAVIARAFPGSTQLVSVRNAAQPLPTLIVSQFTHKGPMDWEELYEEWLNPKPLRVIPADVNNNGEDEIYLLRDVPDDSTQPRLFLRNMGIEIPFALEVQLDSDNGYQEGASGDVLGSDDGRDEIVIIRDNNLRIYTEPGTNTDSMDFAKSTNQRTVLVGDLDANGYFPRSRLSADPAGLDSLIGQGETSSTYPIDLSDTVNNLEIPFAYTVQGSPSWVTVEVDRLQTPARFGVTFDARKLLPGNYRTAIDITTDNQDLVASELTIPITLMVEADVTIRPTDAHFDFYPCEEPLSVRQQTFWVSGLDSEPFTARVASAATSITPVPWAHVEPIEGVLPALLTLTITPDSRTADFDTAVLVVTDSGPDGFERIVPIQLDCASTRAYLPNVVK